MTRQGKEDRFVPVAEVLNFPKITVIEQDPSLPYGNGSPIASARDFIEDDEAFVVAYSDDVVFGNDNINVVGQNPLLRQHSSRVREYTEQEQYYNS